MKEIKAIVAAYDAIDKASTKVALATVVRVEGSSYRRTGARMLVQDNGIWTGGISGGCLEGDALKRAKMAIARSKATLITYDTTQDDEHQIGVGLGCNGIIDVLFTPLDFTNPNNPVELLKMCINQSRKTHTLLTITNLKGSWKGIEAGQAIRYESEKDLGFLEENVATWLNEQILKQLDLGKSAPVHFTTEDNREIGVFIELLPPEIHLMIFGFQYDVYPLSCLVKELGWRVSVVAKPEKVNKRIAQVVDTVISPDEFSTSMIDEHTAIILMSHDYKTDKYNLPKVIKSSAPYIGMLGPRVRSERIWDELETEGIVFSEQATNRIYAPVGLDIGAVAPEEIALSLAAEIRAVFSGRSGGNLRLRQSTIHERG